MKRILFSALALALIAGVGFAQEMTERQWRDPKQALPIWNASSATAGVKNGATVAASDLSRFVNKTVLTLDDTPILTVEGGTGTNGFGSVKLYDFPEGRILVLGCQVQDFTMTVDTNVLDVADGGDYGLGTTAAVAAGGLAGTEVDLCPSTSIDPLTNIVSAALAASAQFDGTTTAKDMYVNIEVDDADIASACTNTVDATIEIYWLNLGDY